MSEYEATQYEYCNSIVHSLAMHFNRAIDRYVERYQEMPKNLEAFLDSVSMHSIVKAISMRH